MDIQAQMLSLINAKRKGYEHSVAEISWLINYLDKIPDYQLSAWLMAVCLRGLSQTETVELTRSMAFSGHVLTLQRHAECEIEHSHDDCCDHDHHHHEHVATLTKRKINRGFVDKHSTGGVGDKTSLVICPLLAAIGYKISKFSGRSLGHTGGTIDKLESIPGFRTDISMKQFERQIEEIGIAQGAQTEEFAPADKRLYALRDKTGTVESIALIASSVMSKKIAGGADHIILDVKVGRGAFMKNLSDAKKLARAMKDIGKSLKLNVQVVLSDMSQPLGSTVGNAMEMLEAISVLKGYKNFHSYLSDRGEALGLASPAARNCGSDEESDFYKLCIELASTIADRKEVIEALESGYAFKKFIELVRAQSDADAQLDVVARLRGVADKDLLGEDIDILVALTNLSEAITVQAQEDTYIEAIDTERLGLVMHASGNKNSGLVLHAKVGDKITKGDKLFTVFDADKDLVLDTFSFAKAKSSVPKLVLGKL